MTIINFIDHPISILDKDFTIRLTMRDLLILWATVSYASASNMVDYIKDHWDVVTDDKESFHVDIDKTECDGILNKIYSRIKDAISNDGLKFVP